MGGGIVRLISLLAFLLLSCGIAAAEDRSPSPNEAPAAGTEKKTDKKPARPKPLITISKETTFVEGPVGEDGYVDLLAALNQRASQDVTKENNAAILLLEIVGPKEIKPEHRERCFRMLGIDPLPEEGDYLVSFWDYVTRVKELAEPGRHVGPYKDLSDEEFDEAVDRQYGETTLWKAEEHPVLAGWLSKYDAALDRVVEATRRPRYYMPLISDDLLVDVEFYDIQLNRELARGLLARALLRAEQGQLELAQDDLLAVHRLARLMGQSPFLIGGLVSIALDGIAYQGEVALVQQGKLTARQALEYAAALRALPPGPKLADTLDFGERLFYVGCASTIARTGPKGLQSISELAGEVTLLGSPLLFKALQMGVDWDEVLRTGNRWLTRMVTAARTSDFDEQQAAIDAVDADLKKLHAELKDPKNFVLRTLTDGFRSTATHQIGSTLVCLMLPPVSMALTAEHRGVVQGHQAQIIHVIAAYWADEGEDPKTLDALVPKYLDKLPLDTFTGKPYRFEIKPDGWLLFSPGPNRQDDEGRNPYDDPPGDDVTIRLGRK